MIQFNLLPDVKLVYLKASRTRRLTMTVAVLVTVGAISLMIGLFLITLLQHRNLDNLNRDISAESTQIQNQKDLNKILTVQNQLGSLTALHAAKPAASRLAGYLSQTTPVQVNIGNLVIDFTKQSLTITGTADTLSTVNKFIDTLKFTTYKPTTGGSSKNAFSSVVLTAFGLNQHQATYTVTLSYDPAIFDITQSTVALTVPSEVTTRSQLAQPTDLFQLPVDTTPSTTGAGR